MSKASLIALRTLPEEFLDDATRIVEGPNGTVVAVHPERHAIKWTAREGWAPVMFAAFLRGA